MPIPPSLTIALLLLLFCLLTTYPLPSSSLPAGTHSFQERFFYWSRHYCKDFDGIEGAQQCLFRQVLMLILQTLTPYVEGLH